MTKYRQFTKKEREWLSEFAKIMKKAPRTLFMFVGGSVIVYTKDNNNERYMDGEGVDQYAPNEHIETKMECDGGDW